MHVKRSTSDRRRLSALNDTTSDSDEGATKKLADKPQLHRKKRKIATREPSLAKKTHETSLNEVPEHPCTSNSTTKESELQLLAIESRRLDFEVVKWKQQQALRRETLMLKSEEISVKETTTRQKQETRMMELHAKLIIALDKAGKVEQANEYLALLES